MEKSIIMQRQRLYLKAIINSGISEAQIVRAIGAKNISSFKHMNIFSPARYGIIQRLSGLSPDDYGIPINLALERCSEARKLIAQGVPVDTLAKYGRIRRDSVQQIAEESPELSTWALILFSEAWPTIDLIGLWDTVNCGSGKDSEFAVRKFVQVYYGPDMRRNLHKLSEDQYEWDVGQQFIYRLTRVRLFRFKHEEVERRTGA